LLLARITLPSEVTPECIAERIKAKATESRAAGSSSRLLLLITVHTCSVIDLPLIVIT
jgi:hypothetical protein